MMHTHPYASLAFPSVTVPCRNAIGSCFTELANEWHAAWPRYQLSRRRPHQPLKQLQCYVSLYLTVCSTRASSIVRELAKFAAPR